MAVDNKLVPKVEKWCGAVKILDGRVTSSLCVHGKTDMARTYLQIRESISNWNGNCSYIVERCGILEKIANGDNEFINARRDFTNMTKRQFADEASAKNFIAAIKQANGRIPAIDGKVYDELKKFEALGQAPAPRPVPAPAPAPKPRPVQAPAPRPVPRPAPVSPPAPKPMRPVRTRRYRGNLWTRFSNFIAGIGNRIVDNFDRIFDFAELVIPVLLLLGIVIGVVVTWIDQGFIWAVLGGVVGGVIAFVAYALLHRIIGWAMKLVVLVVRYWFWNGITFLIPFMLVALLALWGIGRNLLIENITRRLPQTETVVRRPNYTCTANVLNVRSEPNDSSTVVGVLKKGQEVYVYDLGPINGFLRIAYGNGVAYASAAYLAPK